MELKTAEGLASCIVLNDGNEMPLFGLGVSKCKSGGESSEAELAVACALNTGYRLIDTAARYGNEEDVGRAIKKSENRREDIFVVTKLWSENHGYKKTIEAFHQSLLKLDLEYVNLYLIHSPYHGKIVETYKAMMHLQKQGLVRSIGVSNFDIEHLEGLREAGLPKPTVNQIELHPWQTKKDIVNYCMKNSIAVMGYSPLAKAYRMDEPIILELVKKYKKSYAQILIRWSVQKGFITIPKSSKQERILENSLVFDWALADEDMNLLNNQEQWVCGWDPKFPWTG